MAPRLFLPEGQRLPPPGEAVSLPAPLRHYLMNVLRLRPGDRALLLERGGAGAPGGAGGPVAGAERAAFARLLPDGHLAIEEPDGAQGAAPRASLAAGPGLSVTLLLGLLKGEKMDWVVEKATELGVGRLVPVACARSVRRLEEGRAESRRERWQRLATAAAQQSRRREVPVIDAVQPLPAALALAAPAALKLLPYEGAAGAPLSAALPLGAGEAVSFPDTAALLIGPEGGLSDEEVEAAVAAGFQVCGLGPRILRAETAALAALAILSDLAGRSR